ncbi:hypothetical protein CROQUDRAFT_79271 [Cronartium quercuum f. sp. fusiforme G11]|uniref:NADH-cytochrome b5 reductase n=1 Tax=Cronartium quercuum f. sp. fusiforme G11 TaxID=708437 RepID=A0A9P6NG86_9BASI|nr:hypothetical protein CROQUDRAFT_79271 [Cronartium quercuum f. sp. fusiforme G11]
MVLLSTMRRFGIHAYSTAAPKPVTSAGSGPLKWVALGSAGLGGAYWLLKTQGISPGEAKELEDKAKNALAGISGSSASSQAALSPEEWRNFKLQKVIPYNHNTSTFVFELPKSSPSGLTVASALVTKSVARDGEMSCTDDKGKPVIRPYTPVTPPEQQDTLHLLVKKYPNGLMTNHIHSLKPGDQLAMKGPIPKWPYKANEFKTIGMVAGGSGITPHWQIIQEIASNPDDHTKVIMFFSNQKEEDILLREELERLQKKKPDQFSFNFVLDSPPKKWSPDLKGYLTASLLKSKLPSPKLGADVKIFVCGPPGQVSAVSGPKKGKEQGELGGILKELGYTEDQVYKF